MSSFMFMSLPGFTAKILTKDRDVNDYIHSAKGLHNDYSSESIQPNQETFSPFNCPSCAVKIYYCNKDCWQYSGQTYIYCMSLCLGGQGAQDCISCVV